MTFTRLIFAIQTTGPRPTRLCVRGDLGTPAPVMTCLRRGDSAPTSVSYLAGAWEVDLDPGDYVVEIQTEGWPAGRLDVLAEPPAGQQPATVASYGASLDDSAPALNAWVSAGFYTDPPATSATRDPKDPWPPPPPPPPPAMRITLAAASATWFAAQLSAVWPRTELQRLSKAGPPTNPSAAIYRPCRP